MPIDQDSSPRKGDYPQIPDHSDLRGFSYHAPEKFDYRDELRRAPSPWWERVLRLLRGQHD